MDMYNQSVGFRQSLKLLNYWKQKIKDLEHERDNELMAINHKMSGLSHAGVELTEEQAKSDKPMPGSSNHGQGINYVSLIEKKDIVKEEYQRRIEHYQYMIDDVETVLKKLSEDDRKMIVEMYVEKRYTFEFIAYKNGYSKQGLIKHVNKAINKAKCIIGKPE